MAKNNMVAMLLAGGKGSRLYALTRKSAKPHVNFGGKYRIIDFPLSNCANSNVNVVGVLTQYESTFLNAYIGNGEKWGLNGVRALTATLTPRQTEVGSQWYNGTADAIYQNIDWLDELAPEQVLILSGDHIYRMDYEAMLADHLKNKADLTIAVINVSLEEASRFGIMDADKNNRITKFTEKPRKPTSTLASMGIYIFNYKLLRQVLIADAAYPKSERDFGKNIIPTLLNDNARLFAYEFKGYWKDVGTITSYWQANMDLLDTSIYQELLGDHERIFTEDTHSVPQYIGSKASVINSYVNQGAIVLGKVENSIIFNEVFISPSSTVANSVVMPGVTIEDDVCIEYAIIGPDQVIKRGSSIQGQPDDITLKAK